MTQRDYDIELIRAACIKANPSIKKRGHGQSDEPCEDEIRLADVLLAINKTGKDVLIGATEYGACFGNVVEGNSSYQDTVTINWSLAFWNLRQDRLEDQTDQTLKFIASKLQ